MGERLERLERRIDKKLEDFKEDRPELEASQRRIDRKEERLDFLRTDLRKTNIRLARKRDAAKEVANELKEAREESPEEEDTEQEVRLARRLDRLSGEVDEEVRHKQRVIGRIDIVAERLDDVREYRDELLREHRDDAKDLRIFRQRRRLIIARHDRPSKHFAYDEFGCNDGTPHPEQSEKAIKFWCVNIGEPLRAEFGGMVWINSAHRHRVYNARIGGEPNSVHIYDYPGRNFLAVAVDFRCATGNPQAWFDFLAGKAAGRGRYSTFVHADTRNHFSPAWAWVTWTG